MDFVALVLEITYGTLSLIPIHTNEPFRINLFFVTMEKYFVGIK